MSLFYPLPVAFRAMCPGGRKARCVFLEQMVKGLSESYWWSGAIGDQMNRVTMAAKVAISIWLLNGASAGAKGRKMGFVSRLGSVGGGSPEGFRCGFEGELEGVLTSLDTGILHFLSPTPSFSV